MKINYQLITQYKGDKSHEWIAYESTSLKSVIAERDKLKSKYSNILFKIIKVTTERIRVK